MNTLKTFFGIIYFIFYCLIILFCAAFYIPQVMLWVDAKLSRITHYFLLEDYVSR